jgi:hypothetical protein
MSGGQGGSGTIPPHVAAFNAKIVELIKTAQPNEIVDLFKHDGSLLAAGDNNNQNQAKANLEEAQE